MNNSLKIGCEGLFCKIVDKDTSIYDVSGSNRTQWIKCKGSSSTGGGSMPDSLDLIPVAGFHGRGRRTGTYGSYLLAVYDPKDDVYYSI
jgi:DNA ligase-1